MRGLLSGSARVDWVIGDLAERQHGMVARRQLQGLGLGDRAIEYRVELGRLRRVHRGVYAVGHRVLSARGQWMAAVLFAGPEAVLSHRAAGRLWQLPTPFAPRPEVTVPTSRRASAGVDVHFALLPADEVTTEHGIPVTSVPRTILDLAASLEPRYVERAMEDVEVRRLWDRLSLHDLTARYPGRGGTATVAQILGRQQLGQGVPWTELEDRFRAFIDEVGLPRPELNALLYVRGKPIRPDCLWRDAGLIVELDGRATHATDAAFERDRVRDRMLLAGGWRVIRVTWRQLHTERDALEADLRAALAEG